MVRTDFAVGFALVSLWLTSCATYEPRWTPETVAPPASLPEGTERAAPIEERAKVLEVQAAAENDTAAIPLTRDSAILTALTCNRAVEVARFGPKISETFVPEARAAFDPALSGSVTAAHTAVEQGQSLSSSLGSSSGGTSGSGASSGTPSATEAAISTIKSLQQLVGVLNPTPSTERTDNVTGSATLTELLPTGTQLSLTGGASTTDTNFAGDAHQNSWSVGVTQPLLKGAGLSVNLVSLRQAKNRAVQGEYTFRQTVLDITRQVELAYWNLVLAHETLKIREFGVALAEEQLKHDQDWLDVGKAIEGDVLAAQAEKASRDADLVDAEGAVSTQTIALVRLLNPSAAKQWTLRLKPVDTPEVRPVTTNPDESEKLALEYRPELAAARLNLANSDLDVLSAKNGLLPRLDLVASYGTNSGGSASGFTGSSGGGDVENYQVGVQFQTPILYRGEKARHQRAVLTQTQAERSISDLQQAIASDVRQAVVQVEKQWKRIGATQEALRAKTEQFHIEKSRNEVGKTTNLDLLLIQRDLIQAQLDDVTARIQYIQALTTLDAAEGTLLERRGIAIEKMAKEMQ